MALSDVLNRVLGFLRAGYPDGVPTNDYVPLLALLRRRLTEERSPRRGNGTDVPRQCPSGWWPPAGP